MDFEVISFPLEVTKIFTIYISLKSSIRVMTALRNAIHNMQRHLCIFKPLSFNWAMDVIRIVNILQIFDNFCRIQASGQLEYLFFQRKMISLIGILVPSIKLIVLAYIQFRWVYLITPAIFPIILKNGNLRNFATVIYQWSL